MSESQSQDGEGEVAVFWSAARIRGKHAQHSSSSGLRHTAARKRKPNRNDSEYNIVENMTYKLSTVNTFTINYMLL